MTRRHLLSLVLASPLAKLLPTRTREQWTAFVAYERPGGSYAVGDSFPITKMANITVSNFKEWSERKDSSAAP
jgi:hypothetical protein